MRYQNVGIIKTKLKILEVEEVFEKLTMKKAISALIEGERQTERKRERGRGILVKLFKIAYILYGINYPQDAKE